MYLTYWKTLRIPPAKNSKPETIRTKFRLTFAEMKASMEAMKESMAQNNQDDPELFFTAYVSFRFLRI